MEEQKKDKNNGEMGCKCPVCPSNNGMCYGNMCGPHHPWRYWGGGHGLLRFILWIVIIGIIFSFGVKVGELKATFNNNGYGYWGYGDYNHMNKMMNTNGGYYLPMPYGMMLYGSTTPR